MWHSSNVLQRLFANKIVPVNKLKASRLIAKDVLILIFDFDLILSAVLYGCDSRSLENIVLRRTFAPKRN
jgi:hypothetical protein